MKQAKAPQAYFSVSLKTALGTAELIHECAALIGQDEAGRLQPAYYVMHLALAELRDRLRLIKEAIHENPKPSEER